jgi:hypothetical protein
MPFAKHVAVEGDRLATAPEILVCRLRVAEKALALYEAQLEHLPSGIVNEHQQHTRLGPSFKPVMRGAIDLHQFPETSAPFAQLMGHHLFGFPRLP